MTASPRWLVTWLAVALAVSSCATDTADTTLPAEPSPVLAIAEFGGCARGGYNCITRLLWDDGTVTSYRQPMLVTPTVAGLALLTPEATAAVDRAVATDLLSALEGTNWESVINSLPPGMCSACVDGIDFIVVVAAEGDDIVLNSATTAFDLSIPAIAVLADAAAAIGRDIVLGARRGLGS